MIRKKVTIPAGSGRVSELMPVAYDEVQLVAVVLDGAITGTALSFKTLATDNSTLVPVKQKGSASDYTIAPPGSGGGLVPVDETLFRGVESVAIASNADEVSARTVVLVFADAG